MNLTDVYPNPSKEMKILDAGAGTGGVGEMLKARGYTNVDALDISQKMLNLAAGRGLYKKLICAPLTDTHMEVINTAEYDIVLCAGVIVYGQAKPGAIEQCARFVKPGKLICFLAKREEGCSILAIPCTSHSYHSIQAGRLNV